jgi:NAD(P)-dependent dehydrogenase (short-subunit alcohol dehydrogenase family)
MPKTKASEAARSIAIPLTVEESAMSKRLLNKVAIVTGSSSGLGRAIATLYSQEGAKVVCSDLTPSARALIPNETNTNTHELIQQAGGEAIFIKTDVGEANEMEALVESAIEKFGRLDM